MSDEQSVHTFMLTCRRKGGLTFAVLNFHISTSDEQSAHAFKVTTFSGEDNCCVPNLALSIDVGTATN